MVLRSVLISFFYMQLSSFPSTTYWRDCLFSFVYSCLLRHRLGDHRYVGLSLGFLSCSIHLYFYFCSLSAFSLSLSVSLYRHMGFYNSVWFKSSKSFFVVVQIVATLGSLFFFNLFSYFYFWLCWVFVSVWGLSLVAASGGHSSSWCVGLSLSWPLLLRSTGSRCAGSVVVAHAPSCSVACGIFPDQGPNPCALHWQTDSQPLRHQGSPAPYFFELRFTDNVPSSEHYPSPQFMHNIFFANVLLCD